MAAFEPKTKSEEALHDAGLRQFNDFFQDRRNRIFSVTTGIPPIMWYTVAVGALINMLLIWLFNLRLGTHLLLGGLISFFTGTMICLIVLLDHPFRGEVGVSPEAFELIYSQMMQDKADRICRPLFTGCRRKADISENSPSAMGH